MSEQVDENNGGITQDQNTDTGDNGTSNADDQSSGHPAWQEIYDILPDEALKTLIKPHLEKWDQGVQTRFQNLQQQYDPWKPFIEGEVDPEYVNQALGVASALENEPEKVLNALKEAYPDVWQQVVGTGQGVTDSTSGLEDEDVDDAPWQAELNELKKVLEQVASVVVTDQTAREESEGQAALKEYMDALHTAYDKSGGFDEDFVTQQIADGIDGEQAVTNFRALVSKFGSGASTSTQAPPVLSGGGGSPSIQTTPVSGDANTADLVKQILEQANKE